MPVLGRPCCAAYKRVSQPPTLAITVHLSSTSSSTMQFTVAFAVLASIAAVCALPVAQVIPPTGTPVLGEVPSIVSGVVGELGMILPAASTGLPV
ncbi:hypothetical protein C8Q74DRAFT_1365885 [Fomes fomentarius]|nr:hypothetical protein C8Q74DRAFT_1365885 [Fomes fomentarius]